MATTYRSTYRMTGRVRPRPWTELALLGVLYVGYSAARLLADDDHGRAVANARHLLGVESWLHVDVEAGLNHLVAGAPAVALLASYWYAALHYLVTPAALIWVYRRHPLGYRRVRNALVVATATGLAGFVLLPVAPPRMLAGYADVLASTSAHGWWGGDASAPKGLGGLTNEMAAMPSLHVGWAIWCAWVVFLCSRSRLLRILASTYATGTVLVVLGTGNHYLLDAVGGAAVLGLGVVATRPRRPGQLPVGTVTSVLVSTVRMPTPGRLAAAVDGPRPLDSSRGRA
ncbi:MAG TPA: phosphatase PAP2 family protein [Actinomycetes bacterium]|nr:phosphatase PAP2 family protein [Actinomycetes bacterium]